MPLSDWTIRLALTAMSSTVPLDEGSVRGAVRGSGRGAVRGSMRGAVRGSGRGSVREGGAGNKNITIMTSIAPE